MNCKDFSVVAIVLATVPAAWCTVAIGDPVASPGFYESPGDDCLGGPDGCHHRTTITRSVLVPIVGDVEQTYTVRVPVTTEVMKIAVRTVLEVVKTNAVAPAQELRTGVRTCIKCLVHEAVDSRNCIGCSCPTVRGNPYVNASAALENMVSPACKAAETLDHVPGWFAGTGFENVSSKIPVCSSPGALDGHNGRLGFMGKTGAADAIVIDSPVKNLDVYGCGCPQVLGYSNANVIETPESMLLTPLAANATGPTEHVRGWFAVHNAGRGPCSERNGC